MTLQAAVDTSCNDCHKPILNRRSTLQTKCAPCVYKAANARDKELRKAQRQAVIAERKAYAEDRRTTRAKLEAMKSISRLEGECRSIVQKIARIRDRNDGCISCHMGPNYDGQWHGSHYRAHGACSSLQMHLWNIHKSCAQCNLFKGGNKEGYIAGLLAKPGYGRARLDWLDCQPKSKRFDRDHLIRFKAVMGKRMRRLEKRHAVH